MTRDRAVPRPDPQPVGSPAAAPDQPLGTYGTPGPPPVTTAPDTTTPVSEVPPSPAVPAGGAPAESQPPATVALSVAGAARGLGVAPGTLRSWERRYGLGPSAHTAGGHRRYAPVDLARLGHMHRLVQEGVPPAEAAAAALRVDIHPADVDPDNPYAVVIGSSTADSPAAAADVAEAVVIAHEADVLPRPGAGTSSGGGRVLSTPSQPRSVRGLARSAMALDSAACHRALAASLDERGVLLTWEELARPVLIAIGRRWEQTRKGVEIEHSLSTVMLAALSSYAARLEKPLNGRPALLASAADELHDLPLFVLQAALSEVGIRSHLLGARTPPEALIDAASRLGPPVIFLWAQLPGAHVPKIPSARPTPSLIVGGPGWNHVPKDTAHVGDLGEAVGAVRSAMGL